MKANRASGQVMVEVVVLLVCKVGSELLDLAMSVVELADLLAWRLRDEVDH